LRLVNYQTSETAARGDIRFAMDVSTKYAYEDVLFHRLEKCRLFWPTTNFNQLGNDRTGIGVYAAPGVALITDYSVAKACLQAMKH
jgi:hypothetical protein